MKLALRLILTGLLFFSFTASSVSLTTEQINQFKSLSPQQQQALAKQLGVDVSQITSSISGQQTNTEQSPQKMYPRGTKLDQNGQPIQEPDPLNDYLEIEEDELKPFGYELFAGEPSTFIPTFDVPVPANYILGPGDNLQIDVYGKENNQFQVMVNRSGEIDIPNLGPVLAAGKTYAEFKSFVANKIKQQIIGVEVSVSMGELRTMRIFVLGEAYKPGAYTVSSLSTITHALFVSGGVSEIASLRNIQLKRAGKLIETLDLYDLLTKGDTSKDLLLQAGDVVFLPPVSQTVTIEGEVRRPAIYELKNESTLAEAIELAGGILPSGFEDAIGIVRSQKGQLLQQTSALTNKTKVQNGDHIVVPKVSDQVANSVTLIGAVARPGKYEWYETLRLSDLIGERTRDLLDDTDLSYSIIVREPSHREIEILQVDLNDFYTGLESENPVLMNNDKVLIFSKDEYLSVQSNKLDELAFTSEELERKQKERWKRKIETKLFWKELGFNEAEEVEDELPSDALDLLANQSLVELTQTEKDQINEFKDATDFSRKRLLAPVIYLLREQSKLGKPIKLIEVAGAVKYPGVYPLAIGSGVKDILKAAGGLTESAYSEMSEITRTKLNDKGVADVEHISFKPKRVLSGERDIALSSRDRLNIFTIPDWQEELTVEVKGEVLFPGEYAFKRGETLSQLIERAGGLTDYGNADAAVFTREYLREKEVENIQKLTEELRKEIASEGLRRSSAAGSVISYDEAKNLLKDLTKVKAIGRLVIDLESVLAGQNRKDLVLEDGDVLYVPKLSNTVNIIGEVYVPTSHLYDDELDYREYIQLSGGYKELAAEDKVYIVRANGSVYIPSRANGFWFDSNRESYLRAGDTIVVPFDSGHVDNMTLWSNATQILYQIAVSVAAISGL